MGKKKQRILLSGVFGPFGVDDEWGRKENIMELFHNQVTKAQGVASFRSTNRSFGLYFIAQNVDADVTVLDFPSKSRFEQEVREGYDIVGISFIAPNFVKAREMARVTRRESPGSVIVLGGHGAAIEGLQERIDCDHVVKGEGISWMRRYLGQDVEAPIVHPALPSCESMTIMGARTREAAPTVLVPGVGCINGCSFCCTSHFFGKRYVPFLETGRDVFETCSRLADELGTEEFFVLDENFLKKRQRAIDLLAEMEREGRYFTFRIFSSAEAIRAFGVDELVRLGVTFVWIGVESASDKGNFEKNRGIDACKLVKELRERGIVVLASGILCQEHHTEQNIQEDIDFMVDLGADFVQFMLLTPMPVTTLYKSHKRRGMLREDLPFEEWHGQKQLSFRHPAFPGDSAERWVAAAFKQDYLANSSSMYRVIETSLMGYARLAQTELDTCLGVRKSQIEQRLRLWACTLPAIALLSPNAAERARARKLDFEVGQVFRRTTTEKLFRMAIPFATAAWKLKTVLGGDVIQPRTIVTQYLEKKLDLRRMAEPAVHTLPMRWKNAEAAPQEVGLAEGGRS